MKLSPAMSLILKTCSSTLLGHPSSSSNDLWLRGSKSRLAKAAGAEPCGQMRDEKLHAVVAWRTCPSHNVQSTSKHTMLGPLLEVDMWKNCTPLRHEAHFEVKIYKTHHVRTTFGSWNVEKVHAVVARSAFPSQNVQNTPASEHFWKLRCRKNGRRCGAEHISKTWGVQSIFWTFRCRFASQAQSIVHLVKSEQKREGLYSSFEHDGRRVFLEDLARCMSRGRCCTRDTWVS